MTPDALRSAREALERQSLPYALATVVWRRAPTSAHIGEQALIGADGRLLGWIGGACSEPAVIREALRAIREARPRVLCLGPKSDFGPADDTRSIVEGACLGEGALEIYIEPRLAQPRVLVVGETPVARTLVELAARIGFPVDHFSGPSPGGCAASSSPDTEAAQPPGAHSFAVVASFGASDEDALEWLLRSPAPYVALVASRRRAEAVRGALRRRGLDEADLTRLRAPAGLDLGPIRHHEIALAVLAEIVALRAQQSQAWHDAVTAEEGGASPDEAVDPVCGMTVTRSAAREWLQDGDTTVYFCSRHCRDHYASGERDA